jgi:glutamate transport system substrate-binding protein
MPPVTLRQIAVAALAGLMVLPLTSCGRGAEVEKIRIGTKFDQPGLALRGPDGSMSGFDVDVARFVTGQLGYSEDQIEWAEARSSRRESLISSEPGGRLACTESTCEERPDFIVGSYSITPERREKVDFAGPYLQTGQSLLVRANNTTITGPESLTEGTGVCSAEGSTSARRIRVDYPAVRLQLAQTYSECVESLRAGTVDAVSTDEVLLAGYAAQAPGEFKLAGKPFSEEFYGIGLRRGDDELRGKINEALQKMEDDGAWKAAFEKNLGPAGLSVPTPPPIDRYSN